MPVSSAATVTRARWTAGARSPSSASPSIEEGCEVGARVVDQVELLEADRARIEDPGALAVEDDRRRRALGVDEQLGAADRTAGLARGDALEVGRLLRVRSGPLQRQAGAGVGKERRRSAGVAELLAEDHELDHAEPLAAVLLRDRDPGPAELAELLPHVLVEATLLGLRPHRVGLEARGGEALRRRLDLLLLVVESEVHLNLSCSIRAGPGYRSFGRPSTRSAMMFLSTSEVPPSIELARERSIL